MLQGSAEADARLAAEIAGYAADPLGFVLFAFPWGGGALADYPDGPDVWQREILRGMGEQLSTGASAASVIREAVSSGHGVGKSALVAWIILWAMSTFSDTRGVVTANTENQLKGKTWAELAKWHRLCLCGYWFDCTATALISTQAGHEKTWRVDMVAWSERNTEAFAGLHNKGRRVLLIFDEASAIPDAIWEVSEGALTDADTEIIWCCFGNPTRNTGRFRECFGRYAHRWNTRRVDSRTAAMTDKNQLAQWVEDYGEDSDFVRVRVRGEFPRAGDRQFISSDIVHEARGRSLKPDQYSFAPRILGVDVARNGSDQSVITRRQGLACLEQRKFRGLDTVTLAGIVAEECREWGADKIFVDGIGVGAGVVDALRQVYGLGHLVVDAVAGATALQPERFLNRRAEMWTAMRKWLAEGGAVPDDAELAEQLCGLEYAVTVSGKLKLESKDDMKARGLTSPDCADALALTFYAPVPVTLHGAAQRKARTEYDLFGEGR